MNESEYTEYLKGLFEKNKDKSFKRVELLYNFGSVEYRYAFGTADNKGNFYCIPVCSGNVMKYCLKNSEISFVSGIKGRNFEYTGGVFDEKRNCVWGFPRNSDKLLKIDIISNTVSEIELGLKFESAGMNGAHHYSGTLYKDCIYCPPRNKSDGILKISLDNFETRIIPINEPSEMLASYNGSVLHPNGKIYFLPNVGNKITVLDPENEEISFIGENSAYTNFGGVVWKDGNIYSMVGHGVEKIDVHNSTSELVYKFKTPIRVYGSMLHPNGKIYSPVLDNCEIYEYDPSDNTIKVVAKFVDTGTSTTTAGSVMSDGNIYLTPCQGRFFIRYLFENTR